MNYVILLFITIFIKQEPGVMTNSLLKVKTSIGNAPILKQNEMKALITNHVKVYVLTNKR